MNAAANNRAARLFLITGLFGWLALGAPLGAASAQEAEWIWIPGQAKEEVPADAVGVFRKAFNLRQAPEQAQMTITADDVYVVYVNGRQVAQGDSRKLQQIDITRQLSRGRNTVAIRVVNLRGSTAALAARLMVKLPGQDWISLSTDNSWKAHMRTVPLWNVPFFNDSRWPAAQSFGRLGETAPWDIEEGIANEQIDRNERFKVADEFSVRLLMSGDEIGSLIAMTFNEFGQIIASQEGGPLLLLTDSDEDGLLDKSQVYCEELTNCQGLLALNGELYVTGTGPDGTGLYRCKDTNNDGKLNRVVKLVLFEGQMGEHGAHGVTLGPDGYLYVVVGNHTRPVEGYAASSPHTVDYEGELVPRFEDPGGHAVGVKAPGGVVLRTDSTGRHIERFAGGLRNAYDLVFDTRGELFVHDSDMESDEGTPWYRPTGLYHIVSGGEYGWRSGWAKWPEHFVDCLPQVTDTGRGSPTGATLYDHFMFPTRYHNTMFLADWSEGKIWNVRLRANGASFTADKEVFLEGAPLNVCDLEVGPDGSLYFITGGRGTYGGLYRVSWQGEVPPALKNMGEGISRAIRQPQLHSAWGRQQIASIKDEMGVDWGPQLFGVAVSTANPDPYRLRALDLTQLFGPAPSETVMLRLAEDKSEAVRAKTATLMALHPTRSVREKLIDMLDDGDRMVRRKVCESLLRLGEEVPGFKILPLLTSDDRAEVWAARQLLQRQPIDGWKQAVLASDDHRLIVQGGLALINATDDQATALAVVEAVREAMQDFISDRDFIDMLRVVQVAVEQGRIEPGQLEQLRDELVHEFPAGNPLINRELMRLLAFLQASEPMERYIDYLDSEAPDVEKVHVAAHLQFIKEGWAPGQRLKVLRKIERLRSAPGGGSYSPYLMNISTQFARELDAQDSFQVVAEADRWPGAALGALFNMPAELSEEQIEELKEIDRRVAVSDDSGVQRLRIGLIAVMARSGNESAMEHLREVWENEPERRAAVAMGLAQRPEEPNWPYLMRSIPLVDGDAAIEVLTRLREVQKAPAEAEYLRQTILCGLRLGENGSQHAAELLSFWTGEAPAPEGADGPAAIAAWQQWFAEKHPDKPAAVLPVATTESRWEIDELLEFLASEEGATGDIHRGSAIFAKAQCAKCHRYGNAGETLGPDLTSVSKRFTRREILQSILYPSHVISDQYASKIVQLENGKSYTGLVVPGAADQLVVLQNNGEKVVIDKAEIARTKVSPVSSMPEGLLNELSLQDIADMFAYLGIGRASALARRPDVIEK